MASECECGNPKTKQAKACARCTEIDGQFPASQEIYMALRIHGPSTIEFLAEYVGKPYTTVQKQLLRDEQRGRLKHVLVERECELDERRVFGYRGRASRGNPVVGIWSLA